MSFLALYNSLFRFLHHSPLVGKTERLHVCTCLFRMSSDHYCPIMKRKNSIRKAFSIVEPKRVYVDPDCGLKLLPSKIAFEKLRNMCQAARELRNELRKIT